MNTKTIATVITVGMATSAFAQQTSPYHLSTEQLDEILNSRPLEHRMNMYNMYTAFSCTSTGGALDLNQTLIQFSNYLIDNNLIEDPLSAEIPYIDIAVCIPQDQAKHLLISGWLSSATCDETGAQIHILQKAEQRLARDPKEIAPNCLLR